MIIDAPPLLPVTDGAVLTHQADGALVVVSMGKTTYDLLEKSLDTIAKAGGRALGRRAQQGPAQGRGLVRLLIRVPARIRTRRRAEEGADTDAAFNLDGVFAESVPAEQPRSKEKVPSHRVRRS